MSGARVDIAMLRLVSVIACLVAVSGCGEVSSPDSASTSSRVAVMEAASPVVLTGTVNQEVAEAPAVIVRDLAGAVVSGVTVTFATDGNGTLLPGRVVKSNQEGVARVGSWTLGARAGVSRLTASVNEQSVVFTATARPAAANMIQKLLGDNQLSPAGSEIASTPMVKVVDAYLNAIPGFELLLAVGSGGGSLAKTTVSTDASGVARINGWTLGPFGEQTLLVQAPGLATQTFSATAILATTVCGTVSPLQPEAELKFVLNTGSCRSTNGSYYNVHRIMLTAVANEITISSSDFDTYLEVRGDTTLASTTRKAGAAKIPIKTILPPGTYNIVAASVSPNATGSYALAVRPRISLVSNCEEAYIARGSTSYQATGPLDCVVAVNPTQNADQFRIYLLAGSTLEVGVADLSYSDHYLSLTDASGRSVGSITAVSSYEQLLKANVSVTGFYTINVLNYPGDYDAEYALTVK